MATQKYRVRQGDTLAGLGSPEQILKLNPGLYKLSQGQTINLPKGVGSATAGKNPYNFTQTFANKVVNPVVTAGLKPFIGTQNAQAQGNVAARQFSNLFSTRDPFKNPSTPVVTNPTQRFDTETAVSSAPKLPPLSKHAEFVATALYNGTMPLRISGATVNELNAQVPNSAYLASEKGVNPTDQALRSAGYVYDKAKDQYVAPQAQPSITQGGQLSADKFENYKQRFKKTMSRDRDERWWITPVDDGVDEAAAAAAAQAQAAAQAEAQRLAYQQAQVTGINTASGNANKGMVWRVG